MKQQLRWIVLLSLIVVLAFWKIVFTHQFSVLLNHDCATQYAWNHFAASTVKQGELPLWNPYVQAGRTFIGEMQTGVFYPLKLVSYIAPFNRAGLLSVQLLHFLFVFAHILGGLFMFALAIEMGLQRFPAFIAAICFSIGGFVGRVLWPYMLDSAVWLPLVLLFQIRALRAPSTARSMLNAVFSGLVLAIAILAGSIHVPMMDFIVVVGAGLYFALHNAPQPESNRTRGVIRAIAIIAVIGLVALAAAAIQLLPSMEYSPLALRYRGGDLAPLPATQRPPYAETTHSFLPHSLLTLVLGGISPGANELSPYCGVFPFLLGIIGIWQNWQRPWVRYLTFLGGLAFLYSLGRFSPLHGLAYALVPVLWMALQAERFIYLTHFCVSLLAGYGAQTLLSSHASITNPVAPFVRIMKWAAVAAALALVFPAISGNTPSNEWMYLSFLFLLCSFGLLQYLMGPYATPTARFLIVALIFCDLTVFNWTVSNKVEEDRAGRNRLEELLRSRDLARFVKSQPGLFRVGVGVEWAPDIGDLCGIQTTSGLTATLLKDLEWYWRVPKAPDLLNIRYFVSRTRVDGLSLVYEDPLWKVYLNSGEMPRAWVVHQLEIEPSQGQLESRMSDPAFDPWRLAFLPAPLPVKLSPAATGSRADVTFDRYKANRLELTVRSPAQGLLVLSEVYYPGWRATVNGQPTGISKVNGLLRGVVVPTGESKVAFWYAPRSVLVGAIISSLTFFGALAFAIVLKVKAGSGRARETASRVGQVTPGD